MSFSSLLLNYLVICLFQLAGSESLCSFCAGNCSQGVDVSARALLSRIVDDWILCIFHFLVWIIAQGLLWGKKHTLWPVSAVYHVKKERKDKTRRGGLLSCVDSCKLSGWRDTHASRVSLSISPFPLFLVTHGFLFVPPCLTHILPHFSLFPLSVLFTPTLHFSVPYVCLNRFPLFSPCSGISGI